MSSGAEPHLVFGDAKWGDYMFSVEAQKLDGPEGFQILTRVEGPNQCYWLNLGGSGNSSHAFERGMRDGSRTLLGAAKPGRIESARWYQIKVRCEGKHFQAWLDGLPILDVHDPENMYPTGAVGVENGSWKGPVVSLEKGSGKPLVRFRNFKVTTLDDKPLFEGMPPNVGMPEFWRAVGQGSCSHVGGTLNETFLGALNGSYCLEISAERGMAGCEQSPLNVIGGQVYRGSLWIKGDASTGLSACLRDGETVLAQCTLPPPTMMWREFPIEFKPNKDAPGATLRITLNNGGRVWLDQVSLMADSASRAGGFRPDLLKAIEDLRPPIIRWPGGCYAEYYRWKDGIGPQRSRGAFPFRIWDDQDVNTLGTDEFIELCRRVGSEPLIVINTGRHETDKTKTRAEYVREACDWLEYCNGPADSQWGRVRAANGHPKPYGIKYWEIDNETWPDGPANYVSIVREFAPALKAVDPSIQILVCGSLSFDTEVEGTWNQQILDGCAKYMDYLSIHHYEDSNKFGKGAYDYEAFIGGIGKKIRASANPAVKVFVSEWNAGTIDWRAGLYAGGILNGFERQGEVVAIASPALFLRHVSATAWDNAFINFDHKGWFPAPNYIVMKLWREQYAPKRVEMTGTTETLNAVATLSENGQVLYLKLVNSSEQTMSVNVRLADGFKPQGPKMTIVAPGSLQARNTLELPSVVRPVDHPVKAEGDTLRFEMPALSAGIVEVRSTKAP